MGAHARNLQLQGADLAQSASFRRQVDAEKAKQEQVRHELTAQLEQAQSLEIGGEFPRGTLESFVDLQTGDNLMDRLSRAEIIVRERDDVLDLVRCGSATPEAAENIIDVLLAPSAVVDFERLTRHVFTSSSCGVCSKASIEAVRAQYPPLADKLSPRREVLLRLPEKLRSMQTGFSATGGLHASGLFDAEGKLEFSAEDVGRHNALDKVVGQAFLAEKLPLSNRILLVSGRVSFELVQKSLAAGIPCLAAISAPTTAAVDLAREAGQTLVGFLRGEGMNVYAGTLAA